MEPMSKIDDLIKQYCPNGVEYKELGKIVNILDNQRRPVAREKRKKGNIPYYGANGIQDWVEDYIFDGTFLLVGEDGSVINKDNTPILNWATGKIWVNNHAHILSEKIEEANLRYVYFILSKTDVSSIIRGMPPKLNQLNLRGIKIPVPPLPVQEEIVRILDVFSSLEAELEAELEARKKQYEYYRNKLLTFDENTTGGGIEWKMLSEVFNIQRGIRVTKNQLNDNGSYPVYQNSLTPLGFYTNANCQADTTFLIAAGAAGEIGYSSVAFWAADDCFYLMDSKDVNSRYIYHVLLNQQPYIKSRVRKASIPRLSRSSIEKIVIPIPPLEEQERIVAILDKFDSLVNDISEGLPAELTARRQQYEYYRNKLLTFEEAA